MEVAYYFKVSFFLFGGQARSRRMHTANQRTFSALAYVILTHILQPESY